MATLEDASNTEEGFDRILYEEKSEEGWTLSSRTDMVEVWTKSEPDTPVHLIKGFLYLPGIPPKHVVELLINLELRKKWDRWVHDINVIEEHPTHRVVYWRLKMPLFADCDFVENIFTRTNESTGMTTILYKNATHSACPERKGIVRAETIFAGTIVRPYHQDPNSTQMSMLFQNDIKGWIPYYVVNFFARRAPVKWRDEIFNFYQNTYCKELAKQQIQEEGTDEALENQSHYEAYQRALDEEVALPLKYLKVLFFGPPRTGKTSMRRRLVREIQNLAKEPVQTSTSTAEMYDVIVRVFEDKIINSPAVITKSEHRSEWSNVKSGWMSVNALFGKEESTSGTDLDDELRLIYQFIYEFVPTSEMKSPVLSPQEVVDEATNQPGPAILKTDNVPNSTVLPNPNDVIGSNTSISKDTLKAEQMNEIEKAFEVFNKILRTAGQEKLKVLLDGTILMNMVDTGGQPAFLEMLPALTIGPALYLIFFRLNQELKKRYQIQYVSKDREDIPLGDSSYTVEEVIFQALSSIACFSCTAPKESMPTPSHAAMLIGTHKDQLLKSDPETKALIKASHVELEKEILKTDFLNSGKDFLHYAFHGQLMFEIDNMEGDDRELTKVHKRLEKLIHEEFENFRIPASWLMFNIFLHKMGSHTLSLLQCHEIGARLNVRDTDEALWFLHHHVGTLMHFPEVEEIKDIVICNPQVVFDSVTDLILNSFKFENVTVPACTRFKETGQFSYEDIEKIARKKSDNLPLPKLVKLLEHLNIIASIEPEGPQSGTHKWDKLYFMPAVLKYATEKELHMEQSPTDPVPLMIHFKCGFVPVGVFCAMIASLVGQKDTLRWKLLTPLNSDYILCKNKVVFRIDGTYDITLISKPKRYEIHIARKSTTESALKEICCDVLKTVCDTLDQVIFKMKYKQYLMSSHTDQTLYELGFKCPKHPNEDHLVINRPKSRLEAPSHSAKSLWLYYLQRKSTMICLKEEFSVDLRDTTLFPSIAYQSLVWFEEATEISPTSIPVHPPNITQNPENQSVATGADTIEASGLKLDKKNVVNVLHEAKFADGDWEILGQQLIEHHAIRTIRANRHDSSSLCMGDTISKWLNNDCEASWEKLAEAVVKVEGYGEATAHIVRQKAGIGVAETSEIKRVFAHSQPISTANTHITPEAESLHPQPSTPAYNTVDIVDLESESSLLTSTPKRKHPAAKESPAEKRPSLFGGLDYWTGLLDSRKMPLEDKRTEL